MITPIFYNISYGSVIFTIILGAIFGSFSTFLGNRLFNTEKNFKISGKRSLCCNCQHILHVLDLIPILSYIFLRGRCRYCKTKIPIWHFLAEIIMIISFMVALLHFHGINIYSVLMWIICFCLITQSIADYRTMMSSDVLHLIELFAVILLSYNLKINFIYISASFLITMLVMFLLSVIMKKILKKECLGFGDIKLFAILSPLLEIDKIPFFFALCGLFGIFWYVIQQIHLSTKKPINITNLKMLFTQSPQQIPFIPSIYFAFILAFYF